MVDSINKTYNKYRNASFLYFPSSRLGWPDEILLHCKHHTANMKASEEPSESFMLAQMPPALQAREGQNDSIMPVDNGSSSSSKSAPSNDIQDEGNDNTPVLGVPMDISSLPQPPPPPPSGAHYSGELTISKARAVTVIVTLAGITFLNTMGSGILIAALPRIASDVGLSRGLMLWPAAVYSLSAGCLLLIFSAVADVVGPKPMCVTGSFLFAALTVGVGLSRTATQIILFRTLLGAAVSMCLPTAVSLITHTFPRGTWRNVAFACNGVGNPLGYALGLVLGGIFTDTIGWRWSYYIMAMINFCLSVSSLWSLPSVSVSTTSRPWWTRLARDIDWVGASVLSAALGMLLYVLAVTSSSYKRLDQAENIVLLALSVSLLAAFPFWMDFQQRHGRPALIPNSMWRNWAFTSVCVAVFLCWASLNGIEFFTTL